MKIGVILPSRGLVFSKTMESIIDNLYGYDFRLYMAHDLPLPDCFNEPLERALKDKVDLVWFVEEDMVIGPGTLAKILELYKKGNKVVSSEYVDRRNGLTLVRRNEKGKVIYTGMGCLLVEASLFSQLEKPYIRRCVFKLIHTPDGYDYKPMPKMANDTYGTQDVWLCHQLRKLGHEIKIVDAKIGHLQLVEKGKDETNAGTHKIVEMNIYCEDEPPVLELIGRLINPNSDKMLTIIPKYSGYCAGYHLVAGEKTKVPSEVAYAVGYNNIQVISISGKNKK